MGFTSLTKGTINTRKAKHSTELIKPCSYITPLSSLSSSSHELYSSSILTSSNQAAIDAFNEPLDPSFLPIVLFSILLFTLAQSFINSMLKGERGLGAFLSDGRGFKKSAFRPLDNDNNNANIKSNNADPLPWLKLPELDFVDVAGQEKKKGVRVAGNDAIPSTEWD